jgi:Mg-chelatase subunit ChlD
MRFSSPWLLLALPVLFWLVRRLHARSFVGPSKTMLWSRSALLTVLVLALARPEVALPTSNIELLALVDDSASVLPSRREKMREMVRDLAAAHPGLVVWRFGADTAASTVAVPFGTAPQSETRIERALFSAEAALPEDGARRIVLLSDGRETDGDARRAARALGEERIPVYPIHLPAATDPEVLIVGVRTPDALRRGEQIEISITVRATIATQARVAINEGGRALWEEAMQLKTGDTEVRASVALPTSGLVRLRAEVSAPKDTLAENNAWERTVLVDGPPRILLGTPELNQVSALADALTLQGIDVVRFDPGGLPQSLEELAGFDAVILDEIPSSKIDLPTQELLEAYVRDLGGGLLHITGHTGLGTFDRNAPLHRMLPLSSEERVENQVPPVAMILAVDRSGSMEGEKLSWTKRAAIATLDVLPKDAQIGVVAFDAEPHWIADLSSVSDRKPLQDAINSISANGGTRFYESLEQAYFRLGNSNASVKHIVLLTDGQSTDGVDFKPLVRKMADKSITLSTVAMSKDADIPLLKSLAQLSGGRFFLTDKSSEVHRIFTEESRLVAKKAQIDQEFSPVTEAFFEPLSRIDFAAAPKLGGFVVTSLRPGAEQVLSIKHEHPIMARWRYGLGQVLSFASDTDGTWARTWAAWPEYPRLWAELVRYTMRDRAKGALSVDGRVVEGALEVVVDVDEARTRSQRGLEIEVYAVDPGLVAHKLELETTGPGRLRGRLPWPSEGAVVLRAKAQHAGQIVAQATKILDRPFAKEFSLGDDEDTLRTIAQLSGGELLEAATLARAATASGTRRVPLAPPLLAFALFLFFVDLYIKRVRPTPRQS